MITNNPSVATMESSTLRRVADERRAGRGWDELSDEFDLGSGRELMARVAASLGLEHLEGDETPVQPEALEGFPLKLIHRFEVFPLERTEGRLRLAVTDPFDFNAFDTIATAIECEITPILASDELVQRLTKKFLGVGAETVDGLIALRQQNGDVEMLEELTLDGSEDAEQAQQASVVRLVNEILSEAIENRASDIHVEAQESGLKLRYRIDGVLQRQPTPPEMNHFRAAIVSRLKIMAKLNIAEKRIPQDGRIKLRVSGREIDIRVSIIPMLHGEGVVMRVLDKANLAFSLKGIGMSDDVYDRFQHLIRLPHGIILVTGPTGSGKTTTLYSALAEIKSEDTKIITTEDPIEYQLEGINQIQVQHKVGLTFAACLRAILRHDPDVVLVGEIRDLETAENATQASLTGHLVFSTLHTNDAAGAFMRLCDMGVEPFLVSSTVEGIMAQRLVRRLCAECRESYEPNPNELPADFPFALLAERGGRLMRNVGCDACRGTGYRGRMGIYELLTANDEVRQLASRRAPSNEIKNAARRAGMRTLREDGWAKCLAGSTTVDEVLRVTKAD
ncbi:MAG TPA: GspE/PulE family protein [Pirellulaceae bacterium]|nr:GspE/PulE family protein [Pirellulaceae bacterium]